MSNLFLQHVSRLVEMEIITGNSCRQDDGKFAACSEGELKDIRKEMKHTFRKAHPDMCQEDPKFCEGNIGLSRTKMPQLDGAVLAEFVKSLRADGYSVKRELVGVGDLKSSQVEIDTQNALDKAISFLKGKYPRIRDAIVVSREGNILDGHHRWAALRMVAETTKGRQTMNVIRIGMSIKQLIRLANKFEGVKARAMGEAREIIFRTLTA